MFEELETKLTVVIHYDQVTHPLFKLITEMCFNSQAFLVFRNELD